MTRQKRPLGRLRWGTKELGNVWRSLLDSALLPMTIFRYFPRSPSNGSSCRRQTPLRQSFILLFPTPPSNGSSCRPSTPPARVHPVIPLVPQQWFIQCYGQKSNHFNPWCSKFNFVWGGWGGVASFTNISRKVPTLLTSIVATTNEFNFQLTALQSLEFTNSGAPRNEAP